MATNWQRPNKHQQMIYYAWHDLSFLYTAMESLYTCANNYANGIVTDFYPASVLDEADKVIVTILQKLWEIPRGYYQHLMMWYLIASVMDTFGTHYTESLRRFAVWLDGNK